jgi:glycosyltransferase involved in cell wall biosynthesis
MKHKVKQNPDGSLNPTFFDPYNSYWNWKDDRPKPKVAVYTITWNRLDLTKKMYKSLKETADYDFKWFVIDNGSEDDTDKWVVEDKKAECLISNEHNEGISKASNTIVDEIKKGDFDIVVKVDNDAEFRTKGWLKAIVDLWQHNKKLALSPRVEGLIDNPGGVTRRNYVTIANEFMGITYHVGGICIATDISAYKDFKWDEASFKHAEQDVIFSEHLLQRGFIIAYMENYIIEHMGKKGDKKYDEQWQKARQEKPYHMGNGNPELRQDGSSISSPLPPRA